MIWLVIIAMALVAAAALLLPLLRTRTAPDRRADYDIEVYRDQLAELDRDLARGVIGEGEAKAARAEIGRRMLAVSRDESGTPAPASLGAARPLAIAAAAAVPALAVALYLGLGSPQIPSLPLSARHAGESASAQAAREELTRQVASLAERLQKNTEDLRGWLLLARSLGQLGRHNEAVTAWRQVMRLSGDSVEHSGDYAESLVQAADGVVTPDARAAFERVLAADPLDPRSRFYVGLAQAQAGESHAALQSWTDLLATAPPDAPYLPTVRERIRRTAAEAHIDPATIKPSPELQRMAEAAQQAPRGPSAADMEAMQRMSPEERQKAIRGMVEGLAARLEAQPDDVEGWRRLGRAWRVLGEREKSAQALAKAAALAPDRVDILAEQAGALLDGAKGDALPDEFIAIMRRILSIDPNHADALWFVGLAEQRAGNAAAARAHWEKLLTRLPPGSREHDEVQRRLEQLRAAN